MSLKKIKFTIIGAGSVSFCPATLADILLNGRVNTLPVSIALMDINENALSMAENYAREAAKVAKRDVAITATTNLEKSLEDADFVVCAIDPNRYYYWSMDFHIPRRYGFRQIYGENGGPGGMFHTLRNLPPIMAIARAMEKICPNAWFLNYTNPEAKLTEAVLKLTKTKAVGLCHGDGGGVSQLSQFFGIPREEFSTELIGLNHFGFFTKITRNSNGEDLYPLLREREKQIDWLAHWDELGLPRLMLRTFGLYPYPGTNHVGEYVAWADEMLASLKLQYFYDPAANDPWNGGEIPPFVYSMNGNPTNRPVEPRKPAEARGDSPFTIKDGKLHGSGEYGIPIAEAIAFDLKRDIGAVNVQNFGYAPNLPEGMVIEIGAVVDARGIHPKKVSSLPPAIASMIATQGAITQLLIEAYQEQSRNKLLQAMLIDPTVSNYHNSVALINEMCERQKDALPPLHW